MEEVLQISSKAVPVMTPEPLSSQVPQKIAKLFKPRPPIPYVEPMDLPLEERKTPHIEGISSILSNLKNYNKIEYTPTENFQQRQQKEKRIRQEESRKKLIQDFNNWDPESDPQIRGNPYRTLFVGRLDYSVTEVDLQKEFGVYGPVERVRVVRDKSESAKSKGYAFILFETEKDLHSAVKDSNNKVIKGRAITVDVERGRTVRNWKPRRLGGGIGGRGYTKKNVTSTEVKKSGFRRPQEEHSGYGRFNGPREREFNSFQRDRDRGSSSYQKESRPAGNAPHYNPRERERERYREQRIENERSRGRPKAY